MLTFVRGHASLAGASKEPWPPEPASALCDRRATKAADMEECPFGPTGNISCRDWGQVRAEQSQPPVGFLGHVHGIRPLPPGKGGLHKSQKESSGLLAPGK